MCGQCGCAEDQHPLHDHDLGDLIPIEEDILAKNNQFAATNRAAFLKKAITAINVMSSPGSGKTTLLAKTIADLNEQMTIEVIVGDQQTDEDAQKIKSAGAKALQINTGLICHLDAHRVGHAFEDLSPPEKSLLFIENIGNLVCPALFDLGETYRMAILSVTEGDNKPLKYPEMFRHAHLLMLTKMDLLPYVDFDVNACIDYAKRINPSIEILSVSAKTGDGLMDWYQWLQSRQPS